jgi:peptidoglycan-N-acetylmuramic acid deacetylase
VITVKRLYVITGMMIWLVLTGCAGISSTLDSDENQNGNTVGISDAPNDSDDAADAQSTEAGDTSADNAENTTDTENEAGDNQDMTLLRDYDACSNTKYSWYIVRDKNHGISDCDHSFSIEQYDGYYVNTEAGEEKVMYLTFDCGYENGYTEEMLDILKKHNAKACFFVTQTYIRDNVEIVKRMKEEGHQVGNHTVTHPSMPDISVEKMKEELNTCADYMKEATGYDMDMYFRPPSGEYSERVLQLAKDMGYKTIFWSMAYLDYDVNNQPGKDFVIEHFEKYYHNGAIPLIHNVSQSNAEALDTVLTNLENLGYRFASLDEMFN